MGLIVSKLAEGSVKSLEVHYSGPITALETTLVTRGLLAGFLQPRVDFIVNDVNAPIIAKETASAMERILDNGSVYTT